MKVSRAIPVIRRVLTAFAVLGVLAALLIAPRVGGISLLTAARAQTTPAIGFGPTGVVDDQREGGEPDIKICGPNATWSYGNCGHGNPYASAPYGFSTTSSFLWRSEDSGASFKLVPSNNGTGKPNACPGGGDTDLAVSPGKSQASDFLDFVDLQGLTNFSTGISPNGGGSFTCSAASSTATVVDRQWFGQYRDPSDPNAALYLDYDLVAGASCASDPLARGNAFVVQKALGGSGPTRLQYAPPVTADCNDGIAGNLQVNQVNGHIYGIHTGYTVVQNAGKPDVSQALTTDAVYVDRSSDGGATWTRHTVFACQPTPIPTPTSDCNTGQDFAVLAIDRTGGLYAVWSQAPVNASGVVSGPSRVYLSYSTNDATTWSKPIRVDANASTNINLFPWVAAGDRGKVDVVWYGTARATGVTSWDSGSQKSNWTPYMSQSLNVTSATPTFSAPAPISQYPNHYGGICTNGIGCTTGGDRSLADFFQVTTDAAGAAYVIWADTSNNGNTTMSGNALAMVHSSRQVAGPTVLGQTLSGKPATCNSVGTITCQRDGSGDARYEVNGVVGANVPSLDITGSSVNVNPANSQQLDVRMVVPGLKGNNLPGATTAGINDPVVDYLTSWEYHVPGKTDAQYDSTGNVYYAYFEVNRATGATSAYDGNTCVIASSKGKFLVYPGQHAITSKLDPATGNLDLFVPRTDVGNPGAHALLYSVKAHTVGQPGPAGPTDCQRDPNGNLNDPTGQIFNVYDKSPPYTAKLNK